MPPKARFTKQMIEDAAFELAKQRGIEAVAAREVAKVLNMTVTPIFGSFTNMSELRQTVYERAKAEFQAYLRGCLDYTPSFQAYCLRWVCYAAENQNLYRFLMQRMWTSEDKRGVLPELEAPLLAELTELFSLSHEAASELVAHMLIYSGGLCTLLQQGNMPLSEADISHRLSQLCGSLAVAGDLAAGTLSAADAERLYRAAEIRPKHA